MILTTRYIVSFLICLIGLVSISLFAQEKSEPIQITQANNLNADNKLSKENNSVIILYISAPDCPFCKKLEQEVLIPLIKSGEYKNKAILRKINWHSSEQLIDFKGKQNTPVKLLKSYDLKITPTLLFLDSEGNEVVERIIGYSGNEFFWYYLDVAINRANLKINEDLPKHYD